MVIVLPVLLDIITDDHVVAFLKFISAIGHQTNKTGVGDNGH